MRGWLTSGAIALSLALLAGRAAGFLREVLIGRTFGLSQDADVAVILLALPDIFVSLLLAGGLSAALVPKLSSLSPVDRAGLFWQTSIIVGLVFSGIAATVAWHPNWLLLAIAPGYAGSLDPAFEQWLFIAAFAIPLTAMTGVTTALLNSDRKFFIAGCGTLIFNIAVISGMFIGLLLGKPLEFLAWFILIGALVRYASQIIPSARCFELKLGRLKLNQELLKKFFLALVASSIVLLVPIFMRSMASLVGVGNLAAFNYSMKLVELPIGIAITTISTVALPKLSALIALGNQAEAKATYQSNTIKSLKIALIIAIPSIAFARIVVELLFGQAKFSAEQLNLIAELAQIGFVTLPFIAISSMATVALNAQGKQSALLKWTFVSLLVLPFAVLPGIYFESMRIQMCALIVFHAVLALSLASVVSRYPMYAKV